MKKLIVFSLLVCGLLCGCKTTWQDSAAKTLVTISQTVDAAMKAWALHVVKDNVPAQEQEVVKAAYMRYQVSFEVAKTAYDVAVVTKDQSALNQVISHLQANQANLLHALKTFGGAIETP